MDLLRCLYTKKGKGSRHISHRQHAPVHMRVGPNNRFGTETSNRGVRSLSSVSVSSRVAVPMAAQRILFWAWSDGSLTASAAAPTASAGRSSLPIALKRQVAMKNLLTSIQVPAPVIPLAGCTLGRPTWPPSTFLYSRCVAGSHSAQQADRCRICTWHELG